MGALVAAAALTWFTNRLELVIALSAIPGVLAILLIATGIHEQPATRSAPATPLAPLRWRGLSAPTRTTLTAIGLFAVARAPETFLLLRGHELGLGVVPLLLLWAGMHIVKVLTAEWAGRLADANGRRPVILAGYALYGLTLAGLALTNTLEPFWLLSLVLGLHYGLTEGAERALIRDLAPVDERGTAFGWFHMIVGAAVIIAGLLLGGLWHLVDARLAFAVSSVLALLATGYFALRVRG
jgi:hypothetical protein